MDALPRYPLVFDDRRDSVGPAVEWGPVVFRLAVWAGIGAFLLAMLAVIALAETGGSFLSQYRW